jgi:hypothetical protein
LKRNNVSINLTPAFVRNAWQHSSGVAWQSVVLSTAAAANNRVRLSLLFRHVKWLTLY